MNKLIIFIFILSSQAYVNIFSDDCSLFRKYPILKNNLVYKSFCDLPTPITKLNNFGNMLCNNNIYLKRDDLTGAKLNNKLYGGNKARKLEWLLADALAKNFTTIMTYGCVGSNHALATTVYSHLLGFKTILMLKPQPNSYVVRQNLIMDFFTNAEMKFYENNQKRDEARDEILKENSDIYFIPTGGSNKIGAIGFVNAAFELAEQIKEGVIAIPDYIYLPIGSSGTTAGLLLGLALQNLPTKIVAVAVESGSKKQFKNSVKKLFVETDELLNSLDNSVELLEFPDDKLIINNTIATSYGKWDEVDFEAINIFKELEDITIEGTYSSKPIIALINDCKNNIITNKTVLIWETYCGLDFSEEIGLFDFRKLPEFCHQYFN